MRIHWSTLDLGIGNQTHGGARRFKLKCRQRPARPQSHQTLQRAKIWTGESYITHRALQFIVICLPTSRSPFVVDSIANMSTARDIPVRSNGTDRKRTVSNSFDMNQSFSFHSTSPVAVMSPPSSHGRQARSGAGAGAKSLKPFNTQDIKVLLLENVNKIGQDMLKGQGYQVEALKSSLPEDQLIEKIKCVVTISTHGRPHADACV